MRTGTLIATYRKGFAFALFILLAVANAGAQNAALSPPPAPLAIPRPGPETNAPYAPTAILPGGVVIPIYPAGSPFLNKDRVREPEQYNMSKTVPGRINSIVNIHNPSIEFHPVDLEPEYRSGSDPGGRRWTQDAQRRQRGR